MEKQRLLNKWAGAAGAQADWTVSVLGSDTQIIDGILRQNMMEFEVGGEQEIRVDGLVRVTRMEF